MKPSSMVRVYGALISAMVVWGLSFLAIKDAIGRRTTQTGHQPFRKT